MKRKIYDTLLEWKRTSNGKSAIMLDGARRIGKSYIAEEFAKNEYSAYLLVDFATAPRKVKRYFEEYLDDLDTFFLYLCTAYHAKLVPGDSVIIFDEVQRFPRAREAIKYLVKDGRFHYIETGSLISIRKNVKNIVIPSEEYHVKMFPMDFEEFAWATGNEAMLPLIEKRFSERLPVGEDTHRQIMDVFRQYLVVGGMPQAVATFAATRNLDKVEFEKRNILSLYRADIHKFAGALREKVASIFSEIPAQLSKHEKKFTVSAITANARIRDFDGAFEWLKGAMTVNICYGASEPNVGLRLNMDRTTLKCYLGDTGLLISLAFDENELAAADIHNRILNDDIEINSGMIIENIVAQMLRSAGHKLYFYSSSDRTDAANRMEIDFLVSKSRTMPNHNISPIEVKSGRKYSTASLDKYRAKYAQYLDTPFVLHKKDVQVKDGVVYLPLYMAYLLANRR
ncbi:MAG: ATP-binding protein [Kiritimatiellae bacterium]|nr:ATP-binding protein [Kiritimatiellia bacterium]